MTQVRNDESPNQEGGFFLSKQEKKILTRFQRIYKRRWVTITLLSIWLAYCLFVGSLSAYYAYEMFAGGKKINSIPIQREQVHEINKSMPEWLLPWLDRVDFFHIGWTNVLHAVLLLYLGYRSFRRLWRLWHATPQAKLVVKLAGRLEELGELKKQEQMDSDAAPATRKEG